MRHVVPLTSTAGLQVDISNMWAAHLKSCTRHSQLVVPRRMLRAVCHAVRRGKELLAGEQALCLGSGSAPRAEAVSHRGSQPAPLTGRNRERTAWSRAAERLRCFRSSCMQSDGKAVTWIWSSSLARCPSSSRHEVVCTDLIRL